MSVNPHDYNNRTVNLEDYKKLQAREDELSAILRKQGCCFAPDNKDYPFHIPNNVCRCPDIQARLMINNVPGVAKKILEDANVA